MRGTEDPARTILANGGTCAEGGCHGTEPFHTHFPSGGDAIITRISITGHGRTGTG